MSDTQALMPNTSVLLVITDYIVEGSQKAKHTNSDNGYTFYYQYFTIHAQHGPNPQVFHPLSATNTLLTPNEKSTITVVVLDGTQNQNDPDGNKTSSLKPCNLTATDNQTLEVKSATYTNNSVTFIDSGQENASDSFKVEVRFTNTTGVFCNFTCDPQTRNT